MRSAVLLFFCLASIPLSADILDEDFVRWKEWVRKEIRIPEEKDYAKVKIKLKDGREFLAEKKNEDEYVIKMEFGSFTVKKSEIASISKIDIREKVFLERLDTITSYNAPDSVRKLKKEFEDIKQVIHVIDWWLLYLEPESRVMQDKLNQSRRCIVCKGSGSIVDTINTKPIDCPRCAATGKIKCASCRGFGIKTCGGCNGSGVIVKTKTYSPGSSIEPVMVGRICNRCRGKKTSTCTVCRGKTRFTCPECKGDKKVYTPIPCKRCQAKGTLLLPSKSILYPFLGNQPKRIKSQAPKDKKPEEKPKP